MAAVATVAEKMDHHPEWTNVYKRVTVNLSTHDAGGITELDFKLRESDGEDSRETAMKKLLLMAFFAGAPFAYQELASAATIPRRESRSPAAKSAVPVTAANEFRCRPDDGPIVQEAIREGQIPGAVVVVGHKGRVVFQKAYGNRALVPRRGTDDLDTIFDVAFPNEGSWRRPPRSQNWWKTGKSASTRRSQSIFRSFRRKSEITVRNLLTHFRVCGRMSISNRLVRLRHGHQIGRNDMPDRSSEFSFYIQRHQFRSLGEIVQRVSGKTLPNMYRRKYSSPSGCPRPCITAPIAASAYRAYGDRQGIANSSARSRSRSHGSIHGRDCRTCRTILDCGRLVEIRRNDARHGPAKGRSRLQPVDGAEVYQSAGTRRPTGSSRARMGYRLSVFGNPGGPVSSRIYGHTGFTGTSMWIDPFTDTYVILLSNSVHPHLKAAITPCEAGWQALPPPVWICLRSAAQAVLSSDVQTQPMVRPKPRLSQVLNGIDVLLQEKFPELQGKRVGLITNHTGITRDGRRNIDAMIAAGVNLRAFIAPEHGYSRD